MTGAFEGLPTATVNGVSLAYREQGTGEPVVFVHGSASDLRTWEGQVPAVGAGYRAVAYSRRYARPNGDIEAGFGRHSGYIGRGNVAMRKKPYTVMVDDNFHYMDEEHRTKHGAYATFEKAVAACEKIVDEELRDMLKQGVTPEDLSSTWSMYGSDPYIVGGSRRFSARDYVGEKTRST